MVKLVRRTSFLSKIETTYNVDSLPVPALDGVRMMDVSYGLTAQRNTPRPIIHSSLAELSSIIGDSLFTVTGSVFISGSGTAGTPPRFGSLIRACACKQTIVVSTSVAYGPQSVSASHESVTIHINEDDVLHKITGAVGNMTLEASAGTPGKLTFTMTGHYAGRSDLTMVEPTFDTALPPVLRSAGFTVGGTAAVISGLSFDLGNEVVTPDDVNSLDSYGRIIITGRKLTGSIDPETEAVATRDFLANYLSGATYPITTAAIGGVAGNQWQLAQPAIQYSDWAKGEKSGISTDEMPFMAVELVGDDDFTLTLT